MRLLIGSVFAVLLAAALEPSPDAAHAAPDAGTAATAPKLSESELIAATRARVKSEAAQDRFSGAVLIAKDGKPVFVAAEGMADRESRKPNTLSTRFRIGSAGKLFTVVAIMQLAEAGKLDLAAPVARYLPDYPNPGIATKARIGNLLSHTGGTGDFFGQEFAAHRDELRDPADYIALFGTRPPVFEPGAKRDYSNYGFMILGRIIEVVSGLPYDRYVETHIFAPAHMTGSGFLPESRSVRGRAIAYTDINGQLKAVNAQSLTAYRAIHGDGYVEYRGGPAGGSYSTVTDLLNFTNALTDGRLLRSDTLRLLMTGRVTMLDGQLAGYDYGGRLPDGRRFIGHAGGAPGQCANVRAYPASGYTIVVLENRDPRGCFELFDFISDHLP